MLAASGRSPTLREIPNIAATSLAVGWLGNCAKLADATFKCWGEIGNGVRYAEPQAVSELVGVVQLSLGQKLGCALRGTGEVDCWESDRHIPPMPEEWPPTKIDGLSAVARISTGADAACAVLSNGTVSCWGHNEHGELGQGTADSESHLTPLIVPGIGGAVSISMGIDFGCALQGDGGLVCWGSNQYGQLGLGESDDAVHPPTPVAW